MPTVLSIRGFAFRIYPNDHEPAHIHVWRDRGFIVVRLPSDEGRARLVRARGMKDTDIARAIQLIEENQELLWNAWRVIHGDQATG